MQTRRDREYWCDHTDPSRIPERLQELLQLWRYREPNIKDFGMVDEIFPEASYLYVLAGMGFKREASGQLRRSRTAQGAERYFQEAAGLGQRMLPPW